MDEAKPNEHGPGRSWGAIAVLAVAAVLGKGLLAARWGLLADEAYYWVWSQELAWGYFDHPPAIAGVIAGGTALVGDTSLGVRLGAVGCGALAMVAAAATSGDRLTAAAVWIGAPVLLGLTLFATPDAPLLACWAVALAAAARGDRWWLVAGAAAGLAVLAKASGVLVLPLLLLGAGPRGLRGPWPWLGAVLGVAVASPHLWWIAASGHDPFSVQLSHGLLASEAPGLGGLASFAGGQLLAGNPVLVLAAAVWVVTAAPRLFAGWRGQGADPVQERAQRMAWTTTVGVWVVFGLASLRAPSEANWAAPALVGAAVGLAGASQWLRRTAIAGVALGVMGALFVAVHVERPLIDLPSDPVARLLAGPALARTFAAARGEDRSIPVYTERYQEAALLRFYGDVPAFGHRACGRPDQFDLMPQPPASPLALFVRPTRSGDALCDGAVLPVQGPTRLLESDAAGRAAGDWQLFVIAGAR